MCRPNTFTISYDENISDCEIDQTYHSFCKYGIGISKYTCSTLTLEELGKFPLSHKDSVIALACWLRMEQGTEDLLLNKAFNSMKRENHPWLQNVYCFLCKIGLKEGWRNHQVWSKRGLKLFVTQRLNYINTTTMYS